MKIGQPLPGYTGVSRRVVADNVFGATYADARKKAQESLESIHYDKQNNLLSQSATIPPIKK